MSLPCIRVEVSRAPGDCTICALAMLLGKSYEDVLGAAVKMTGGFRVHHKGMWTREIKRTAKKLGVTLKLKRSVDLEHDEGILSTENEDDTQHSVLLSDGMIIECDGTVWREPDTYLSVKNQRVLSLLIRGED